MHATETRPRVCEPSGRPRLRSKVSVAPAPLLRLAAIAALAGTKFITIEPIMEFDTGILARGIIGAKPNFVNIGADSKRTNLPEPDKGKVLDLIAILKAAGIDVRLKGNLDRLLAC